MSSSTRVPMQAVAWLGLDVSKATFHAAVCPQAGVRSHRDLAVKVFPRSAEGVQQVLQWAREQVPAGTALRVVMESTGSYSRDLFSWLVDADGDLAPAILNPHAVLYFAKSLAERTKTDRVDARVLARYGAERGPAPFEPPEGVRAIMRALLRHREALVSQRSAVKEQRSHGLALDPPTVTKSRDRVIKLLDAEIEAIDAELCELVADDAPIARDVQLLSSIHGIGLLTACILLAELGDLRRFRTTRQLTSFAGLAPRLHESGKSVKGRSRLSKAGSTHVRRVLYTSAMVSVQGESNLSSFYQRLRANGKAPKAALIAVARKLLTIARSILVSGRIYDKLHAHVGGTVAA